MVSNSSFFKSNPELDERDFLIYSDQIWSYKEFFEKSDFLFKNCEREVVLILCSRDIGTLASYIGAARNNLIPLLVEGDIKDEALERIINKYKPRYIFHKQDRSIRSFTQSHNVISEFSEYVLSEYDVEKKELFDDLGLLLLTSGSTGDPKSVRITHSNLIHATKSITEYLELSHSRIAISMLPFHYSYGLSVLHNALMSRSKIFLSERSILEKEIWDEIIEYNVTDFSGVPFIFEIMSRMKISDAYDQLSCITQAGGKLAPKYTEHFLKLSEKHNFKYFTMYGQTEASPRISYVPYETAKEKLGTVGIPISCGSVSIDKINPDSDEGELIYEGPNVCLGYAKSWNDLNSKDEFKGKIRTGDIVTIDDDGFISIIGRTKRFVKLKGISVNMDHIESLIQNLDISCHVIGKDDKIVIVLDDVSKHQNIIQELIQNNFNFHKSLINYEESDISYLPSGKPNYQELNEKFL